MLCADSQSCASLFGNLVMSLPGQCPPCIALCSSRATQMYKAGTHMERQEVLACLLWAHSQTSTEGWWLVMPS